MTDPTQQFDKPGGYAGGEAFKLTVDHPDHALLDWPATIAPVSGSHPMTAPYTVFTGTAPSSGIGKLSFAFAPRLTQVVAVPMTAAPGFPLWMAPNYPQSESTLHSWDRHLAYGATGLFLMQGPGARTLWNSNYQGLAAAHGDRPVSILFSPKNCTVADLTAFLEAMKKAAPSWLKWLYFAFWQEPWDNFTDATATANYRQTVAALAKVIHQYGAHVMLEIQADAAWYVPGSRPDRRPIDEFIIPGVTDCLGFSYYSYNGTDNIDRDMPKLAACATRLGLPWSIAASAMPLKGSSPTQQDRQRAATWMGHLVDAERANHSFGHGHYNYLQFSDPPSFIDGDSRVETLPEVMAAFRRMTSIAGALAA